MAEKSIAELLAPTTAEPDATLTALDVFEDKSKDADDAMEYGMGLSQAELLDIVMSVLPMGGASKAGKGGISFLKGLLGKAKSKAKFPVGYGEPRGMSVGDKQFIDKFMLERALGKMESINPSGKIFPKGIKQIGKFNRQLNDPNYIYQKNKTAFDKEVETTLRKLKKHNDEMGYDTFEKMVEKIK